MIDQTHAASDGHPQGRGGAPATVSRLLGLLVDAHRAMIRATDEAALLDEVCRLLVASGDYRSARIEMRDTPLDGAHQQVTPAGAHVEAVDGSEGATIILPLRTTGTITGTLQLQAAPPNEITPATQELLNALADDVAFGVETLRAREAARRDADVLRERHWQLEASQRLGHLGSWHRDLEANEIRMTAEAYRIFGIPPVEGAWSLADWHPQWARLIHPDDRARVAHVLAEALADREPYDVEYRVVRPTGEIRHVHSLAEVERDATGRPLRIMGTMHDVTERKRAEETARAAERQLVTLMEHYPDGVSRYDADGRIQYASPAIARAMNRRTEELLGRTVRDVAMGESPRDDEALMASIARVSATGKGERLEVRLRTADGVRDFEVRHVAEFDECGAIASVLGIASDLTERKAAARQLYILNYALDHVSESIFLVEGDAPRFTYANQSAADRLGYRREELSGGMGVPDIDPEWPMEQWNTLLPTLRTARHLTLDTTHRTRDGRDIPIEVTSNAFEFEGQHYLMAIARDISERRAAEAALRTRELQLRTLVDNTPDIILRLDLDGRYLFANAMMERVTGVPVKALIGQPIECMSGLAQSAHFGALQEAMDVLRRTGRPAELEMTVPLASGAHEFNVRLVPEEDADGALRTMMVVARDITAQKRAEANLRASEQRFRQVTEAIDEVFWLVDAETNTGVYVSPAYPRVFGRSCESFYAVPGAWLTTIHPDDVERFTAARSSPVNGTLDLEYRILRGGDVAWIRDRAFPIRDADGRTYLIAGVAEDITVRRGLEDRLRQAQKMEAIGQLAGGIAHDFNNMLAIIQLQSHLLLEEDPATDESREGLREILTVTQRAANLTRQLLTFSRQQVSQLAPLDLAEVLGSTTKLLRRILGEDVSLTTRFASELPLVNADAGMMEQVLMNLAINARDAMPHGGHLTVDVAPLTVSAEEAAQHPDHPPGAYVCLSVSDTGEGIAAELLPRIFDPFFTTKDVGKGTGLGLATVFGIMQQHGGWIDVESTRGVGTTFRACLPALPANAAVSGEPLTADAVRGGSETILLVEDEAMLRSVTREMLERLGYRVLTADTAVQAVATWNATQGRIDLLMTDLVMPGGRTGRQLAEELLAKAPTLRVLFCTGYSADVVGAPLDLRAGRGLLQKPYTASELARAVRRVLDDRER